MANTLTTNIGLKKPANGDGAWDVPTNANWDQLDTFFGNTVPYLPRMVAKADLTGQTNNVGTTTLYAVPATGAGFYRVHAYVVITSAAVTSSTMPAVNVQWTDNDTSNTANATASIGTTSTVNSVGVNTALASAGAQCAIINAKASTNITWTTTGYASNVANTMTFTVHIKLEYLGL